MNLSIVYKVLEIPAVYKLNQWVGRPTVAVYDSFLRDRVPARDDQDVLELGCGTGASRPLLRGRYVGVDINPRYVADAARAHSGRFLAMDCTALDFPDGAFDHVVSVATFHHLSDAEVTRTVREALRVLRPGGRMHVIDPIYPRSRAALFKRGFFAADRGRFQRELEPYKSLLRGVATLDDSEVRASPLHDVAYFRLAR